MVFTVSKADKFRHKEHTRKRKDGAEASVENCNVFKRDPALIAQGNSPGHYEDHNTVGFQVKKTQNTAFLPSIPLIRRTCFWNILKNMEPNRQKTMALRTMLRTVT